MARFKLTLEYDGGAFFGWQRLAEGPSVQGCLEAAAFKLCGERVEAVGAGRTDAGVHALGQVAHVDIEKEFTPDRLRDALDAHLRPEPVAVLEASLAAPDFHARFDATNRVYRYRICNRRADLALDRGRAWRIGGPLDAAAMHEAAQLLLGNHDFTTFRDSQCQAKSPVKTLDRCDVTRRGAEVEIWCEARSFLHRQVRSIVGTLAEVGLGNWTAQDVAGALAAADRARCGPVAPAEGLYLARVDYERPASQ
jgi:tRNA pseudouridine38-40 synthase